MAYRSVSVPSDGGFFSSSATYNASDVSLSSGVSNWRDSVGKKKVDAVSSAVSGYNRNAAEIWRNIEKLSKIKADVQPYESSYQLIEELRCKAKG